MIQTSRGLEGGHEGEAEPLVIPAWVRACADLLAQCHRTQREILHKIMLQHAGGFPAAGGLLVFRPLALEC